jgi:carboxymethylenebutenolidase
MIVTSEFVDLDVSGSPMRTMIARPKAEGTYPGLVLWSDIFQLTESMQRAIVRFASYGFVVAAPEMYHRFLDRGHALDFERDYALAQESMARLTVPDLDADLRATLAHLRTHPAVGGKALHATGFCIGGHLAVRAALDPGVRSAVAFYPTGMHANKLGGDEHADTLHRVGEIAGDLLIVFGSQDPHIPLDGRRLVDDAMRGAGIRYHISEYDGEHAFMRDVGPRYNASETDRAYAQAVAFLHQYD